MKNLLFIFISYLVLTLSAAKSLANPAAGSCPSLCALAARQYLAGKGEESLALYQKAIAKAETEYGKNSQIVADLNYQLGVRSFWLSKFNLSERSLKKAVELSPNSEPAQLMLIKLLRFRNRQAEAYTHTQAALKKHTDSAPLRRDLVIALQETNPANATRNAFFVSCVQNGLTDKLPGKKAEQNNPPEAHQTEKNSNQSKIPSQEIDKKGLSNKNQNDNKINKKNDAAQNLSRQSQPTHTDPNAKAVYEPADKPNIDKQNKIVAKKSAKQNRSHKAIRAAKGESLPAGLVPPPPPDAFGMVSPPPRPGLKAKANAIQGDKPESTLAPKKIEKSSAKAAPTESTAPASKSMEHAAESDPDFLIEWASVKKKKTTK